MPNAALEKLQMPPHIVCMQKFKRLLFPESWMPVIIRSTSLCYVLHKKSSAGRVFVMHLWLLIYKPQHLAVSSHAHWEQQQYNVMWLMLMGQVDLLTYGLHAEFVHVLEPYKLPN